MNKWQYSATKIIITIIIILLMFSTLDPTSMDNISTTSSSENLPVSADADNHVFDRTQDVYHMDYHFYDLKITDIDVNGEHFQIVTFGNGTYPTTPGQPWLPYEMRIIGIPTGSIVSYRITGQEIEIINGITIFPCPKPTTQLPGPQISPVDEHFEFCTDEMVYSKNSLHPDSPLDLNDRGFIRDQEIIRVKLYPARVNPVTHQLLVYRHIGIDIIYHGGHPYRYIEPDPFNDILKDTLVNYDAIAALQVRPRTTSSFDPETPIMPLSNQEWYKVTVDGCGIYEMSYTDLQNTGIDTSTIDPRTFKIFNAGGGMLSEAMGAFVPPKVEIPIYVKGQGDGKFDSGDSITFYGFSYASWENNIWTKNYYEDKNVYWLTWGGTNGKRMVAKSLQDSGGSTPGSFHKVIHLEEDHEISNIDTLDYRDQVIWRFSEVGSAPWTNGVGLVKQAGDPEWADYNLSLNASRLRGSKGLMIIFRVQGPNAFYVLVLGDDSNTKIKLCKATPANTKQNLKIIDGSIITGETYQINISVKGNNIKCFINGSQVIDYSDNSNPYLYGNIGLNLDYDTVMDFWDIKVNGTNKTSVGFSWSENFTAYPLRSNAYPVWTNLQGVLSDMTVRMLDGHRVYESTTECLKTSFEIDNWDTNKPVKLRAWVKGEAAWKEPDKKHRTSFYINGNNVLDHNWTNYNIWNAETIIANPILRNGSNTIEFDLPGNNADNWDYQSIDWFEVDLWKDFSAYKGYLEFNHSASAQGTGKHKFVVTNFSTSNIQGFKIFNFSYTERITNPSIILSGSTYNYEFSDSINSGEDRYIIVEAGHKLSPISIEKFVSKGLNTSANNFSYLLITHKDLYTPSDPNNPIVRLANHRAQKNGLNVTVITTQDIYDEFSNGLFDPTAIRNFIQFAYDNWDERPKYVLFAGDASNAFKLSLARGTYNVPTHLQEYSGEIEPTLASDNWLCCVSGDDLFPDMIPGRLPIASLFEAENMVNKIIAYDNLPNTDGWRRNAVFHADDTSEAWEAIFKQTCQKQIDDYLIPNGFIASQEAYRDDHSASECKNMVTSGVNDGCIMLQYSGHGSPNGWENFHNNDIVGLNNNNKYPFVMSMGCSTGKFDMPTSNSFCEEIILAADKGGIASWGPSRTAYATLCDLFHDFSNSVFNDGQLGIGAGCYNALVNKASDYHLYVMTFFGDPAMNYGLPFMEMNITTNYLSYERGEDINVQGQMESSFSGTLNITIRDDNMALWQHDVTTVTNGMFNDQFSIPTDASYGTYRIFAFAWDGPSHRDGLKYLDFEVTKPGCNLHITDDMITFSPEPLLGDRVVSITTKVLNLGTQPTGDFNVRFFLGDPLEGNEIGEVFCSSLERSGCGEVSIIWETAGKSGSHEIYIVLDMDNLVSELNEGDNKAKQTAFLLQPPKARCGEDIISFRNIKINFSNSLCISPESEIVNYTWDFGDGNISFGHDVDHSYSLLGSYNVSLTIMDARNITDTDNLSVFIINQWPTAMFEVSRKVGFVTTPFYFNTSSYDKDGEIVQYYWDFGDGSNSTATNPIHYYSKKGDLTIKLTIFDNDGGNDTTAVDITIGNLAPNAVFKASNLSVYTGVNITFNGSGSSDPDDNNSVLNYTWTFVHEVDEEYKEIVYSPNVTWSFPYNGVYNVSLQVSDPPGKSDLTYMGINVLNRAPTFNITVIPIIGTVETNFIFILKASDPDGYISQVFIDLGDDSVINKTFSVDQGKELFEYTHSYDTNKNKTIHAYVADNDGSHSEHQTVTIAINNLAPTIDLGGDRRIRVDQVIHFEASVLDKDGQIMKYEWDFNGDEIFDNVTTQPKISYAYTEQGYYSLILKVTDNDNGSAIARINITVTPSIEQHQDDGSDDVDRTSIFILISGVVIMLIVFLVVIFVYIMKKRKIRSEETKSELDVPVPGPAPGLQEDKSGDYTSIEQNIMPKPKVATVNPTPQIKLLVETSMPEVPGFSLGVDLTTTTTDDEEILESGQSLDDEELDEEE